MTSVPHHCSIAAMKPLALASFLFMLASSAIAQVESGQRLSAVTVSESRFENKNDSPIGATVITAAQIRDAGVGNVSDAIRKIGGIYGRQNLYGTSDYSFDLRGFGENSERNIVFFLDGVRISENEMANALLSSIAIESVERIEIVRGGSSVLYGDGATAGTIQIITKRGERNTTRGSAYAEIGSFDHREARASLYKGWDAFSLDANVSSIHTDNYRQNNGLRQDNFSGGLRWDVADWRMGIKVESSRQDNRFPGALTMEQFSANPRQTFTPDDYGSFDTDRYSVFMQRQFDKVEVAADLARQTRDAEFFMGGLNKTHTEMTQFSPRLRYIDRVGSLGNELVAGVDLTRWNKVTDGWSMDDATQRSQAFYFRDELKSDKLRVAFGARHEKFKKIGYDGFNPDPQYKNDVSVNAWSLEGAYVLRPAVTLFAKAGRSYRIANVDDNAGKASDEFLKPQTSNDLELGVEWTNEQDKITARVFRHKLKNEIYYDPIVVVPGQSWLGTNINLDPTKHQGVEIEARTRLTGAFGVSAVLQYISAKFDEGPYAGREMTLIPKNTASLRVNWLPGNGHTADVGVQWASSRRFGGDFTNACSARMPAFATLDARYARKIGTWEFAISGTNLTDKDYYTQAYGECADSARIYPEAGRAIQVSVRKDF